MDIDAAKAQVERLTDQSQAAGADVFFFFLMYFVRTGSQSVLWPKPRVL